jgi:hypothetical protein
MEEAMKRHGTGHTLLGLLLLVFLLAGQVGALLHDHRGLAPRRNCPVCVQSAHDPAAPETGIRVAFGTRPEALFSERSVEPLPSPAPAPADARSPPTGALSA